ncbi:MAG: hypothetical protein JWO31_2219 [Phycisphaerales bacterium]|nr:hypothetical protein [Phycisphaerales bacterium]
MFPLAGKAFPTGADELTDSIRDALAEVLTLPKKGVPVTVDAPDYPKVKRLVVNLDGASVSATEPPPKPELTGKRQPGLRVKALEVSGRPVRYESSQVEFGLTAEDVGLAFAKDKSGRPLLVLTDAAAGKVDARVAAADIQTLALAAASAAAAQQGIKVQSVDVDLRQEGKRSVVADVRVKAKKMMVSGVVRITARLDVDDALTATVSGLNCTGEGVVGSLVAGVVQPKLKAHEGHKVPLVAFSLGDVTLRDLTIDVKDGLRVAARFGKRG